MLLMIDTSGPACSTALYDLHAGELVAELSEELGRGHAERLMPMLEELLLGSQKSWNDITRLGVINGPGSFTGVRVGIATARGLALALGVPCNTLSAFRAFEAELGSMDGLGVVIDARRDQIWMQCFHNGTTLGAPHALAVNGISAEFPDTITRVAGSAARLVADILDRDMTVVSEAPSPPIAAAVQYIASQPPAEGKPAALYLRAPDAKPQAPLVAKA